MYSVNDIAEAMKVNRKTVVGWIKKGILKANKPGKQYKISEEQFSEFKKKTECTKTA